MFRKKIFQGLIMNAVGAATQPVRKVLSTCCFFLLAYMAQAQPQPVAGGAPISELKGAELYTQNLGSGNIRVFLNVYYHCQTKTPAREYVSLFETMGKRLVTALELQKDTEFVEAPVHATPCFSEQMACVKQVRYSIKKDLGLAWMDYTLSWAYGCFERGVLNLDHQAKQGFALQVDLPNPATAAGNRMPSLNSLPLHHLCRNSQVMFACSLNNVDSDEISYRLSTPFHYRSKEQGAYQYTTSGDMANIDQPLRNPVFTGSMLTNHPPFEYVQYAAGYSASSPFSDGNFKLDPLSGKMEVKAVSSGKYLLAITLQEKRDKKLLSEHSIVMIVEVQ